MNQLPAAADCSATVLAATTRPVRSTTNAARLMRSSASTAPSPYASANLPARLAALPRCGADVGEASRIGRGERTLRRAAQDRCAPFASFDFKYDRAPPWQVMAAEKLLVEGRVAAFLVAGDVVLENDRTSGVGQGSSAKRSRVRAKPPFRDKLLEKVPDIRRCGKRRVARRRMHRSEPAAHRVCGAGELMKRLWPLVGRRRRLVQSRRRKRDRCGLHFLPPEKTK